GGARSNRSAFLDDCFLHFPIGFGLQTSASGRGARVRIVNEHHAVANENVVFDGHTFADEGVAGDLAAFTNRSVLLNLYKRANLGFIADFAAVEVDELGKFDISTEFHTRRNAKEFIHKSCLTNHSNATGGSGREAASRLARVAGIPVRRAWRATYSPLPACARPSIQRCHC